MNYSILLRNNTTKETSVFNKTDQENSRLYYHFKNVDTSNLDEGEYTYYIILNPESETITIYPNNIEKSTINGETIVIVATGLVRVGNYDSRNNNTEYNYGQKYKQYR